ncbi:MAG: hypothetical protein HZC03_00030 [Candidatus Lloydbacteria bacterium]|nr:hypothetical protein [Candidatus Lloydbacteria bacterium]
MKKSGLVLMLAVGLLFFVPASSFAASDIDALAQGCMKCHKEGGSKIPDLHTVAKGTFMQKMKEYQESGEKGIMSKKAKELSSEQVKGLADYFSKK